MPVTNSTLTVKFEALNRETSRVKSWRIDSEFLTSTDGFEFVLYDTNRDNLRYLELEPVELTLSGSRVSGAPQVLGRIDATETGGDGSAVTCRGRDYISDMVECHVDPALKVTKDSTLAQVIGDATAPVGITTIIPDGDLLLRNARTGVAPGSPARKDYGAAKLDEIKPQPNQGIYDFCNRLCARNGATIQPYTDREALILTGPDYQQDALYSIRRTSDRTRSRSNNIVTARAIRDFSSFPTLTIFHGKSQGKSGKSSNLNKEYPTDKLVEELGGELQVIMFNRIISERRKPQPSGGLDSKLYRLLYQKDSEAKTAEQIERVAVRAMSELLKNTLVYTVTLKGHEDPDTGALYGVNTVIDVQDEITNVYEKLWIAGRALSYAEGTGAQTELTCWRLGAFQVGI